MNLPVLPGGEWAARMPVELAGILCFGAGIALLLFGWMLYRIQLMALGFSAGALAGNWLAPHLHVHALILIAVLGGLGVLAAWFMEKLSLFCLGGFCGMLPVLLLLSRERYGDAFTVMAVLAFVIGGLVTLLLWKSVVILLSSLVGSVCIANAALLFLDQAKPGAGRWVANGCWFWLIVGIGALTALGVLFQTREEEAASPDAAPAQ